MGDKHAVNSLILEPLEKGHASTLFAVLNDPKIYTYIPEEPPINKETLADKFDVLSLGAPSHSGEIWLNYAVYDNALPQYIGTLQATITKKDLKASVAYLLNSNYWGKGYAKHALSDMMTKLIKEYGILEFEACIDTRNVRSIKLVERLGFKCTDYEENADFFKGNSSNEYTYTMTVN